MFCEGWIIVYESSLFSEGVIIVLMPNEKFLSYILGRTSYIWWDDDDVYFVLDQYTQLDFYSASSLKQHSVSRYVAPLWHIYVIQNQPVFALTP